MFEDHENPASVPIIVITNPQIKVVEVLVKLDNCSNDGACETHEQLNAEDKNDLFVGTLLNCRHLVARISTVHHHLSLVASVHSNSNNPFSVSERATSEQKILNIQANLPIVVKHSV